MYLHWAFSNRCTYLNTIEAHRSRAHRDDKNGAGPSGTHHSDNDNDNDDDDENLGGENDLTREDDKDEFADSDDNNSD